MATMASTEEKDKKPLVQSSTVPAASSSSQAPPAATVEGTGNSKPTNEGKKKMKDILK